MTARWMLRVSHARMNGRSTSCGAGGGGVGSIGSGKMSVLCERRDAIAKRKSATDYGSLSTTTLRPPRREPLLHPPNAICLLVRISFHALPSPLVSELNRRWERG
jgi:hypothetical protein